MDARLLQTKIYQGYAKAAKRLGYQCDVFRPAGSGNPLALVNRIAGVLVSVNAKDFTYSKPNLYGSPIYYGMYDGSVTLPGDYLVRVSDGSIYFVAAQQPHLPIALVECNRTVSVYRPQQQTGIGAQGYGGDTDANETPLMLSWPASLLQGPKGEKSETHLPGDARNAWAAVLMPAFAGVVLRSDDILIDDLARRFVLSSVELTDLGYRMTAMQAQT